jgi:hypothetical protein
MPRLGFEPTIPVFERVKRVNALDRAVTVIGNCRCTTGSRARLWYMHDGAPTPSSRAVRDVPSDTSHNREIGTGGPTAWLPHSPDVNPLDLYPWDT